LDAAKPPNFSRAARLSEGYLGAGRSGARIPWAAKISSASVGSWGHKRVARAGAMSSLVKCHIVVVTKAVKHAIASLRSIIAPCQL